MKKILVMLVLVTPLIVLALPQDAVNVGGSPKEVRPAAAVWLNASGSPIPVSSASPLPVTTSPSSSTLSAPGTTPSPSPAMATNVQQSLGGTTQFTNATVGDAQGSVATLFKAPEGTNASALLAVFNFAYNGATWDRLRTGNVNKDLSAVTIDSITTVWTPTSGKKFRLMGGTISVSAAMNVLFEDNAASAFVFRTPKLAADTPFSFVVLGGQGKLSAVANNVLKATGSAAGNVTGTLYGTEE